MATPVTMEQVLLQAQKDPVGFYIGITVAAAQPPMPAIVVQLTGRRLILPDWSGREWLWYGELARKFAKAVDAGNPTAKADMQNELGNLESLMPNMRDLGDAHPKPALAQVYYTHAVRTVIAANAANTAESRLSIAGSAIKTGILEAPATILNALKFTLEGGLSNMTKVQRAAAEIAAKIFLAPVKAIAGGFLAGLGPMGIAVIAGGLYLMYGRK